MKLGKCIVQKNFSSWWIIKYTWKSSRSFLSRVQEEGKLWHDRRKSIPSGKIYADYLNSKFAYSIPQEIFLKNYTTGTGDMPRWLRALLAEKLSFFPAPTLGHWQRPHNYPLLQLQGIRSHLLTYSGTWNACHVKIYM